MNYLRGVTLDLAPRRLARFALASIALLLLVPTVPGAAEPVAEPQPAPQCRADDLAGADSEAGLFYPAVDASLTGLWRHLLSFENPFLRVPGAPALLPRSPAPAEVSTQGRWVPGYRPAALASGLLALAVVAGGGCTPSPDRSEGPLVVQVRPFEVRGQAEGAEFVGSAFAESIAGSLTDSRDLRLLAVAGDGEGEPAEVANRLITGTLTRDNGSNRAELKLLDPANGELPWQVEIPSDTAILSDLAFQLAMRTIEGMELSYPDLYRYTRTSPAVPSCHALR